VRIVHLADSHLDRPFVGLSSVAAERRRTGLVEALRRCLGVARARGADLVTVGGDLWEAEHVRGDTMRSVAHELGRLDAPVLVVCGNHDPLVPGGAHTRVSWPENVTVAGTRLGEHRYGPVSVWAISWGGGPLDTRFLTERAPGDGRAHVLLLHGTAAPVALFADGAHGPFDPARVVAAGYALCLAGHLHRGSVGHGVVYPGSPEPLDWTEDGGHGVAVVDVVPGEPPRVELVDVAATTALGIVVDCTGAGSSAEVRQRVEDALGGVPDLATTLLRVRLEGTVDPECDVEPVRLQAWLAEQVEVAAVDDRTRLALDLDARAARRGVDGAFVRLLRDRLGQATDERERRTIERALELGVRALDGGGPLRVG
jgi:DNA repair exonuclease SbcCD nuclease subunit